MPPAATPKWEHYPADPAEGVNEFWSLDILSLSVFVTRTGKRKFQAALDMHGASLTAPVDVDGSLPEAKRVGLTLLRHYLLLHLAELERLRA